MDEFIEVGSMDFVVWCARPTSAVWARGLMTNVKKDMQFRMYSDEEWNNPIVWPGDPVDTIYVCTKDAYEEDGKIIIEVE